MKIHQIIMVLGLGFSSILQAARLTPEQQLGGLLYKDRNLSLNRNQACATCHAMKALQIGDQIAAGFVDPNNALTGSAVSKGSQPKQFGALNAPTVGYAAFSPEFHWSAEKKGYIGGQFWNGRAKNLQEQAKGPFLNPAEMAMPNAWAVITRLQENSLYIKAFKDLYAIDLNTIPPYVNNQPEPPTIAPIYDKLAKAISEFEKSFVFNKFTAKLDYVFAKKTNLTQQEKFGMDLFRGKARCTTCHTDLFKFDAKGQPLLPPLFSDFSYHNVGSPRNVTIPNNPYPDLGLGFRDDIREIDPFGLEIGKHKVISLRNVAMTPPYYHNGVLKTLEQVVHFYNTRDKLGTVADNTDSGFGINGWAAPEVPKNIDNTIGNLGLTPDEEKAIVAFLKTLTDDYPNWGKDPLVPPGSVSPYPPIPIP